MTEPSGYELDDVLTATAGCHANVDQPLPAGQRASIIVDITDAIRALTNLRDDHVTRLHPLMAGAPRGGLKVDTDQHGVLKIAVTSPLSRSKVRHDELLAALDQIADTPAHRVDPATGEDLGRAAARLKLRERCSSPNWKWAELEHLGLTPAKFCVERTDTKLSIVGDGVKLSPMKVAGRDSS